MSWKHLQEERAARPTIRPLIPTNGPIVREPQIGSAKQLGDEDPRLLLSEVHAKAFVDARAEWNEGESTALLL